MNKKSIFYGLILLLTLSLTLGVVAASDNFANETVGVSLETQVNDVQLEVSNEKVSKMDSDTLLRSTNEDNEILNMSNDENSVLEYGETVTTLSPGPDYVRIDNEYTAFCVNTLQNVPPTGSIYSVQPTNIVTHTYTNQPTSNLVKLAIVYYSDNPDFQKKITHGNGVNRYSSRFQHLIWYLTGYFGQGQDSYFMNYLQSDSLMYHAYNDINKLNRNGEIIPDHYTYRYNDTHEVTYDFAAFKPNTYGNLQMLLGYKKVFTQLPTSYEIQKVTLTPKVPLNDQVTFELIYKNTGNVDLYNAYIVEEKWDDGLVYDSFIDYRYICKHCFNE